MTRCAWLRPGQYEERGYISQGELETSETRGRGLFSPDELRENVEVNGQIDWEFYEVARKAATGHLEEM